MENVFIDVSHPVLHPDTAILRIKGHIYANTLPQIDRAFQTALNDKKTKIIFDLSETDHISSGGWGLLIASHQQARDQDAAIALVGMNPEVRDAFQLLEYDKVLPFFDSAETALAQGFGRTPLNQAAFPA